MAMHSIYTWLTATPIDFKRDAEDAHVVASIVTMSLRETSTGCVLTAGLGISGPPLRNLIAAFFPHALALLERFDLDRDITVSEDEECLRDLLGRNTTSGTWLELQLAPMISRRAMRPNHLWQDLGLGKRGELSHLMARHFAPLSARNSSDMKWKKFFFRMICRDDGYRLCTAPSCAECDDFEICFGDESGESLLARVRREPESPAMIPMFR